MVFTLHDFFIDISYAGQIPCSQMALKCLHFENLPYVDFPLIWHARPASALATVRVNCSPQLQVKPLKRPPCVTHHNILQFCRLRTLLEVTD